MLEAAQVPEQQALVAFIHKGISGLKAECIRVVKVYGRQAGEASPSWSDEFNLAQASERSSFEETKDENTETRKNTNLLQNTKYIRQVERMAEPTDDSTNIKISTSSRRTGVQLSPKALPQSPRSPLLAKLLEFKGWAMLRSRTEKQIAILSITGILVFSTFFLFRNSTSPVVGAWARTSQTEPMFIEFRGDGTYVEVYSSGGSYTGRYKVIGEDRLQATSSDETVEATFTVVGDSLVLKWDNGTVATMYTRDD